jgi:hypothetical protein
MELTTKGTKNSKAEAGRSRLRKLTTKGRTTDEHRWTPIESLQTANCKLQSAGEFETPEHQSAKSASSAVKEEIMTKISIS